MRVKGLIIIIIIITTLFNIYYMHGKMGSPTWILLFSYDIIK